MALHIKTDGTETVIPTPSSERIAELVGGPFCYAPTHDGRAMFAHDEGLLIPLPYNAKATRLYASGGPYRIHGDVVVFDEEETRRDREG